MLGEKLYVKKEYKVEIVKEGALGSIFLGASNLPVKKLDSYMVITDDNMASEF